MDPMKQRVRAFAGAALVVVCPVLLLAVSLKKVDTKSKGNMSAREYIAPVAAVTLEAGLVSFLCLCLCLSKLVTPNLADRLFRASKELVLLCGLLLMGLAYGLLHLIDVPNVYFYLIPLFVLAFVIISLMYNTWGYGHDHDAALYTGCDDKLETSIDFSASVTVLLFLALEGLALKHLALEGQSSSLGDAQWGLLAGSIGLSFIACLGGVCIMLLATVPVKLHRRFESGDMCNFIEVLNILLATAFAVDVFLITFAPLGEVAWLVFIQPFVYFLTWISNCLVVKGETSQQNLAQDVKPASMELTKVAFASFLAVSVPAFSKSSVSICTSAFVLITGAAVIAGLLWRLLTHMTPAPSARVNAADCASFCAHLYVVVAVIPFAVMASEAIK